MYVPPPPPPNCLLLYTGMEVVLGVGGYLPLDYFLYIGMEHNTVWPKGPPVARMRGAVVTQNSSLKHYIYTNSKS